MFRRAPTTIEFTGADMAEFQALRAKRRLEQQQQQQLAGGGSAGADQGLPARAGPDPLAPLPQASTHDSVAVVLLWCCCGAVSVSVAVVVADRM